MACLGGSVPCFAAMVVLHDGRASYICILLVIPFLIKLICVVLRNRLSNVARDSRKCQASAHFLHSSGRPIIGTVNVTVKLLYVLFIPLRFGCISICRDIRIEFRHEAVRLPHY